MLVGIVVLALLLLLLSHERAQHSHSLHLASVAASSGHALRSALRAEPPLTPEGEQHRALRSCCVKTQSADLASDLFTLFGNANELSLWQVSLVQNASYVADSGAV